MPELAQPKSKKEVVSKFRQSEILSAARKVFAEKGYVGTTVDEIAARAEVAKGTIYVYFDSKEQIYNAVLENDLEVLLALTLERIAAAGSALEKISAYINTRFDFCEQRRDFFRIMLLEPSESTMLSKARTREWLCEPVRMLTVAIEDTISKGQMRHWPAEILAWTITDLTSGALQRRLVTNPTTSAREDADFLIDFIYAALCPSTNRSKP